jgi:hypothetical protein
VIVGRESLLTSGRICHAARHAADGQCAVHGGRSAAVRRGLVGSNGFAALSAELIVRTASTLRALP